MRPRIIECEIITIFTLVLLLAGCAAYQPKPLSSSQAASAFEARTLESPDLKKFIEASLGREVTPWPPQAWDFHLLSLAAYYYHPELDVARARWGVAQAGVITAGQRPNPSIGFTPQYSVNPPSGDSPWILDLVLQIPIETAGKRGYRIAQARDLSEAARLNISTVAWQVRSRLRTSLLNFYAANQSELLLKKELAVQDEFVKVTGKRLEVGEVSQPDVTLARLALDQIRLSLSETQRLQAEALVRVAEALGLPPAALREIEISFALFDNLAELPVPDVQRQALLNRKDILTALAAYAAAQSALQLEIAKQYPDIRLGPTYIFDQGQNKWGLGLLAILPVFNQNQGPIAEAEARRAEAEAHFHSLQSQVIGEIGRGLAGYRAAIEKLKVADSVLSDKEKQQQSVQAMFNAGESDRLALLGARLELVSITLARLDALVKAQQSLGALEDAIQYPLDPWGSFPVESETNPRAGERAKQ